MCSPGQKIRTFSYSGNWFVIKATSEVFLAIVAAGAPRNQAGTRGIFLVKST
jgi:hypothetical protein